MIKTILTILFLFFYFMFGILTYPVIFILGKINMHARHVMCYKMISWSMRTCRRISGAKVEYIGLENIPKDQAVLYVGNHRSFFDIIINYAQLPPLMGFVSKKEIGKIPFLSRWMKFGNCLFLDRDNIKEGMKTILKGVEQLKSGISIFIFPEGHRGKSDDSVAEFHEGSLKMAVKAKVPVIPVAITNSSAILEDHFPKIKKAKVIVEYGKPVIIDELDQETKKHIGRYTHDIIEEMVRKNKELL